MVAFKDYFDRKAAKELGARLERSAREAGANFDAKGFVRDATQGLSKLEFNDRVGQFADAMHGHLPGVYGDAIKVVVGAMDGVLEGTDDVTNGYLHWPMGEYIKRYGTGDFDASFEAMIELTQRLTSEFAVRPFVRDEPKKTFARLRKLTKHESPHVRRWCSEGVRPRLPWGEKLVDLCRDPSPIEPILHALVDDPVRYVTRSVANTLGDIAKDHPERAVAIAAEWLTSKPKKRRGDTRSDEERVQERRWVVRHGLRHLIKQGDPKALALFGYAPPKKLSLSLEASPSRVAIGGATTLSLTLTNRAKSANRLLVDYRVHFVKKTGKTSPKVFKWREVEIAAGETLTFDKKQPFKPASTRALYAGEHVIDVQVNGVVFEGTRIQLKG